MASTSSTRSTQPVLTGTTALGRRAAPVRDARPERSGTAVLRRGYPLLHASRRGLAAVILAPDSEVAQDDVLVSEPERLRRAAPRAGELHHSIAVARYGVADQGNQGQICPGVPRCGVLGLGPSQCRDSL